MSGSISMLLHAASGTAAYQRTAATGAGAAAGGENFAKYVSNMLNDTIKQGSATEQAAKAGLEGSGNLTQVVTSVAQAQLALQTTVAIRDRLVTAYQSIMSMPI